MSKKKNLISYNLEQMYQKPRMKGLFIAGLGGVCVPCPEFVSLFLYACLSVCVCVCVCVCGCVLEAGE